MGRKKTVRNSPRALILAFRSIATSLANMQKIIDNATAANLASENK